MPSGWKRLRYRLEWLGLVAATKLVPLFPRAFCWHLAHFIGAATSVLDRHGRKVALNNLELAFGSELSEAQRRKITRESFQHFAATMLELLWSPRLTRENYSRYIEFENFEEMTNAMRDRGSFILAVYHYSNFEWLSIAAGYGGLTGMIISQEFKNSLLDQIFKSIRERPGHEFVPRERGIIRLYKALRRGTITAMLVDLTIPPGQGAVAIDCFGLKTSVTGAAAWLLERTGVPIIPAHCEPLPKGRYCMVFHPRVEYREGMKPWEIAQTCWNMVEPVIRKNPAPWLWMYKHWRYRPTKTDRSYPFYSHIYERFDDILDTQAEQPAASADG
jgi:Kdo2-lipid IVA lauroyltransferase/acyltransferase